MRTCTLLSNRGWQALEAASAHVWGLKSFALSTGSGQAVASGAHIAVNALTSCCNGSLSKWVVQAPNPLTASPTQPLSLALTALPADCKLLKFVTNLQNFAAICVQLMKPENLRNNLMLAL